MTFNLLPARLAKLREDVPKIVALATNEVAREIHNGVMEFVSVDTSKALSNWQVSVGEGIGSEIEPHVPGTQGETKEASKQIALDKGASAVKGRIAGTDIHIVNNASYIDDLDSGKISNNPGFVSKGLLAGKLQVQSTKLRLS